MRALQIADRCLELMQDNGIEEWSSSHSVTEVRVSWEGDRADGWKILAEMLSRDLPVLTLRRCWRMLDGEVTGPRWEIDLQPDGEE